MTTRTTQTIVRFVSAFMLPGFDSPQPAGDYRVDHDEEPIDGLSRPVWRRVLTFIHLPAIGALTMTKELIAVNPTDLEAALAKDRGET